MHDTIYSYLIEDFSPKNPKKQVSKENIDDLFFDNNKKFYLNLINDLSHKYRPNLINNLESKINQRNLLLYLKILKKLNK